MAAAQKPAPELALYRVNLGGMTHYATAEDAFGALHAVVEHLDGEGHYVRENPVDLGKVTTEQVGTVTEHVLAWGSV